jgi:hypothetical protein
MVMIEYRLATIIVVEKRKHLLKEGWFFTKLIPHGGNDTYFEAEVTKWGETRKGPARKTASAALQAGKDLVDNW